MAARRTDDLQQLSDAGRSATALHVLLDHDKTFSTQLRAAIKAGDTKAQNQLLQRVGFQLADTAPRQGAKKGAPPPMPQFCFRVWKANVCVKLLITVE